MKRLQAIIFDMDGTIADTEEIHRQAFNTAFDEYGIPCHWDQGLYKELLAISGGRERIKKYLVENLLMSGIAEPVSGFAAKVHKTKSEIYRRKLVDGQVGLRPGIRRLMEEARANRITMAVATSSSTRNVETLLKSNLGEDALSMFRSIVSCDIVEEKKPSPAVYEHVLGELGIDPSHCIALEDTLNGNSSAQAAGITTVITTHMFTMDDDFPGASLVVNHLGEPDTPLRVLAGTTYGSTFVTIELLERILENKYDSPHYDEISAIAAE